MARKTQPGTGPPRKDEFSAHVDTFMQRVDRFWQRVTEGMQLSQLWSQFQTDARSSYRLYSNEVDSSRTAGVPRRKHFFNLVSQFFWAILLKLTPARRVLLLIALILLCFPSGEASWQSSDGQMKILAFDTHFWGGLLLLVLLILEVADRVVMKRDLQIAKEIQAWLLPANPPQVPGLEIAFATRPANTVAGDYYDVFARPGADSEAQTFLLAVADVAGKSIPAAMLMATFQASLKTLSTTPGTLTELVGRMNRYACSNSQNGRRFTTAFIAEYDPASRWSSPTSMPDITNPMLRRRAASWSVLETGGMPLGIMEDVVLPVGHGVSLQTGDWLVIFTDGVVEAENNSQQEYGEERLTTMLNAGVMLTPAGAAQQHSD